MRSLALVVLVFAACTKAAPTAVAEAAAPSGSSAATAPPCGSTLASYDALVASGGACTADADCTCFNGGVSTKTPCGGVTDKATAVKLETLTTDYESGHCNGLSCAAYTCIAACNAGRCVNNPHVTAPPVDTTTSWTACASDLDCTYVSLGCCDTTPVNRAYVADAKRKLERSGRPYCPPKTACGPGADGTWAGAPGKCTAGNCGLRSM